MVDGVIRACAVFQGFCLPMATNQEEGVGKELQYVCYCNHCNNRFVPVFGFMSASTIQIFKIILHRFVLMYCSLKLLAELE